MIPSQSSVIASTVTLVALQFTGVVRAFILGAFISLVPIFFLGLIIDRFPSRVGIISSIIVIVTHRLGMAWWVGIATAVVVGTSFDIISKTIIEKEIEYINK